MPDLNAYPKPSLAVDLAILTVRDGLLNALLVQRDDAVPGWAMPGGFVHVDEALEATVARVLRAKVGRDGIHFEQLATYGALDRDPRGRVVSVVYLALCPPETLGSAQLAVLDVDWPGETGGPARALLDGQPLPLAFDHALILGDVVKRLRGKLDYSRVAFAFLGARFTLRAVQEVHEVILGHPLTKPPFRRKLLDRGMIEPTGEYETGGAYRPAEYYRLKPEE